MSSEPIPISLERLQQLIIGLETETRHPNYNAVHLQGSYGTGVTLLRTNGIIYVRSNGQQNKLTPDAARVIRKEYDL